MPTDATLEAPEPLSPEMFDKAFRRATCLTEGAPERWRARAARGQTDLQLAESIEWELGAITESMQSGFRVACVGAGLKIWIGRGHVSRHKDKPTFQGGATIRKVREFYSIPYPSVKLAPRPAAAPVQLSFF